MAGNPKMRNSGLIEWKFVSSISNLSDLIDYLGNSPTQFCDSAGLRIKDGPHRTVWRCVGPWGDIHIKKNPLHNLRAISRRFLRPSKSEMEAENAFKLKKIGIDSLEILAIGQEKNWCGADWLVTKSIAKAKSLDLVLNEGAPPRLIKISKLLGNYIAKVHQFGVFHSDLHPANFLIDENDKIYMLDIHNLSWTNPSLHKRIENLSVFNRWFQIRSSPWERTRFFKAYFKTWKASDSLLEFDCRAIIKLIEKKTYQSNQNLWANRDNRCLSTNREYVSTYRFGFRKNTVRDLPEYIEEVLDCPLVDLPISKVIKQSKSSIVGLISDKSVSENRISTIKILPHDHIISDWIRSFLELPGKKAWRLGHAMINRFLPTPRPTGYLYKGNLIKSEERIIFDFVPQAIQLDAWFLKYSDNHYSIWEMAIDLGSLIRRMHMLGVRNRDLKAANILIDINNNPVFIDLAGVSLLNQIPESIRLKDLARLSRSAVIAKMGLTQCLRFFKAYQGGQLLPQWKDNWRYISKIISDSLLRLKRKGRPLG